MNRLVALLCLLATLVACAQDTTRYEDNSALLDAILPPESVSKKMSLSQEIVAEFQDERQTIRVEVDLTPTRLAMVGLTHIGVPLFSLVQEGEKINVEVFGAKKLPFDSRRILSDFQIAFWPPSVLRKQFKSFGLTLKTNENGHYRRVVGQDGSDLVEVIYINKGESLGDVVVHHYEPSYRLYIRSIEAATL